MYKSQGHPSSSEMELSDKLYINSSNDRSTATISLMCACHMQLSSRLWQLGLTVIAMRTLTKLRDNGPS